MSIERELKVVAEAGAALPDMTDVVEGVTVGAPNELRLSAKYFDTPDLALIRSGVTLRSRMGEPGPAWTLKLPSTESNASSGTLRRHEVDFDEPLGAVPPRAIDAVTAYSRGVPLTVIAEIETQRWATDLRIGEVVVATICDDHVQGRTHDGTVSSFREIEVEVVDAVTAGDLLKAVRSRMRDAGWKIEVTPLPKLARVLGDSLPSDSIATGKAPGRKARLGSVVDAAIAKSLGELITFDAGTRLDLDIEDLHQFRVASRRLRSDLRTFRRAIDATWVRQMRAELRWLGEVVGAVRDLDVLAVRLEAALEGMAEFDSVHAAQIMANLAEQREVARTAMLEALRSERYLTLLNGLVDAVRSPHRSRGTSDSAVEGVAAPDDTANGPADELASAALPVLVRKAWKQLKGAAEDLGPDATDDDLHDVRILAKRARYAAEAATGVCGRDAKRFAAAIKELQSLLGDHQDTVVTERWLRTVAHKTPEIGLLAGLLIAEERAKRAELRDSFDAVWKRTSRATLRNWLH